MSSACFSGVAEELLLCCLLAPLMYVDLRQQYDDRIVATDASSWGEAGVSARAPRVLAKELARHTCAKGAWTRLLSPSQAWLRDKHRLSPFEELPSAEESYRANPLFTEVARRLRFSCDFSHPKVVNRHINMGEMAATLEAEALRGYHSSRIRSVSLSDSQVVCGALTKGRSASRPLCSMLRQSLGLSLTFCLTTQLAYVRSGDNPADDPTCGKEVRDPAGTCPDWLSSGFAGDFRSLDAELDSWGLQSLQVTGLPLAAELLGGDSVPFPNSLSFSQSRDRPSPTVATEVPSCQACLAPEPPPCKPQIPTQDPMPSDVGFDPPPAWTGSFQDKAKPLLSELPKDRFLLHPRFRGNSDLAFNVPGYLDLYSGKRGVAKKLIVLGAPWVLCYDIDHDPAEDLLSLPIQQEVLQLIRAHVLRGVGAGPLCTPFSTAVTPPIRTKGFVQGVPWATAGQRLSLDAGNKHCSFCVKVVRAAVQAGAAIWVENPDNSWLWRQPSMIRLAAEFELGFWRYDCCRFGSPWRKRTKVLTNTDLQSKTVFCRKDHEHVILRGKCKGSNQNWTRVAQVYPRGVCQQLAMAQLRFGSPSIGCAGGSTSRIGEAANPGPSSRVHRLPRTGDLTDVALLEPATVVFQDSAWRHFEEWLRESLLEADIEALKRCPQLLALLLAEYGYAAYRTGLPLHLYRQLVAR